MTAIEIFNSVTNGGMSPMGDLAATSECQIRCPVKWRAAAPFDIW
jgi:hypothetical protein